MKIKRNSNAIFETPRRRRRLPIIPVVIVLLLITGLGLAWQRGGEQPQVRVEKPVSPSKLGQ